MFTSLHLCPCESRADFKSFYSIDAHDSMSKNSREFIKLRISETRWAVSNDGSQ
jgi:hypothetical protein